MKNSISNKYKNNIDLHVHSFSGATIADMDDYVSPTLRSNPDVVVVHVGTNCMGSKKGSDEIAEEVVSLACHVPYKIVYQGSNYKWLDTS